eukprot:s1429_g6.t1
MSQRVSDWESIRQGPGKRSCKRSLDQTSGSSSSNQNSGALSDWLPGATVQTLAETYVSYIIAVLSCLSQRGSSQGIDEPADLECRGVPAFVASCWAQESPKLSITRSADWRVKPWVAARHGTTATFLEVVLYEVEVEGQASQEPRIGTRISHRVEVEAPLVRALWVAVGMPRDLTSRKVTVTTPIYVRLSDVPISATTPLLCAFLDGDVWSQEGVRVATEEELNDFFGGQVNTTGLWCATTHLSIFSAFVDLLLDCTNVNVLSQDGLEEIFRNWWWFRLPALLLWLLLAALLCLLVVGVRQDRKLYSSGMWSDEYFLTELPPVSGRCSLSAAFSRCRKPQQMMPTLSTEKSMESVANLNEAFNDWVKKQNLQPRLSNKLQETILCQNTLREVALQHMVHPSFMVGHIWGPEGWVQGSLAMTKSKKLKSFQLELEEGLPQAFVKAHSSRVRRVCSTCVATHPVCELWQWDLHITSAKRAKIIADCILGSLAFVALFFSVDGTAVAARSPENCPVQQGTFLWYTFVAIMSILLNLIPRGVIMYIAYRGFVQESTRNRKWQLRLLRFKDACFWILGVVVSSIQLLVIIAFLANLSEVDEWKWLISFSVVLVRKMLLVPLLACLFASLGTEIAAWSQPSIVSQPPKRLGLDMDLLEGKAVLEEEGELTETWTQKVEELAQRGITIRQLLDFYASLGGTLMPHFDPDRSTTHDVVRQAIIPNSLHYRNWRTFMVVVHQASDLAAMDFFHNFNSDPYCIVRCVSASMPKPWKGGGQTTTIKKTCNPKWEEAFLLHEVVQDESLHLSIWDQDVLSKDDALGEVSLAASDFWDGFDGTLPLQGPGGSGSAPPTLQITVTSYLQRSTADDALDAFQAARRARSKLRLRGWTGTLVFESEPGAEKERASECEGDSWCLGCSAIELSQGLLKHPWKVQGLRAVAEESLLSSARLVRAFANLDQSLSSGSAGSADRARTTTAKSKAARAARSRSPRRDERPPLPRSPRRAAKVEPQTEKESEATDFDEEGEEEEEDFKPPTEAHRDRRGGDDRPPEPEGPPPGRPAPKRTLERPEGRGRERNEERSQRREYKPHHPKRRRRGGAKHQKRHKDLENPFRRSHRKIRKDLLELAPNLEAGLERRY